MCTGRKFKPAVAGERLNTMWNKPKKDDLSARPEPAQTAAPSPAREAIPTSAYPSRRPDEAVTRGGALIGKSLILSGKISGREDLVVDGRIEGDVDLPENKLTVGAGGHVQGGIRAREVVVYGTVHGNTEAVEKVEIKRTARPVIEEESYFKGNIETVRAEAAKTAVPRPPVPEPPLQPALPNATPAQAEARPGEPRKG